MSENPEVPDPAEAAVLGHLDDLGADYETVRIDPAYADTAEFCAHYGYSLDDSANCIVVASKDDPPTVAACLNLAPTKLDVNKAVRKHLGVRKLSFAPPDLTREVTGMELGGVTPFGLPDEVPLLVDAAVLDRDRVIVGGGSRSLKILVAPEVFARIGEVVEDLAVP
ncbi:MAG: hypothetical protein KY437_08150 [Actinobacteria bacterium]|nr:hypothetical protein [Actinomycetota bacterium]